ncbi:quinone oxidoreductase [Streptomyces sp. NPDC026672]|uniref:quinone oxidoreductase family protein n=1 Tax=unclassified Streptomyces TaxID=2593676 RepID=UPI0033EBAEFD
MSETAREIRINRFGPPEVLELTASTRPAPGPGQALVEVHAIGVNYMDVSTRQGFNPTLTLPATLGVEGSGTVKALGDDVDDLHVGQRVAWYYVPGSYTDLLLAPADALVPVPDHIDHDTAAGLLMQGLTAQHLARYAHTGGTALVHSAAGGVGSLLTQLLAASGITVLARVSAPEKAETARRAGASHVIVDRAGRFAEEVRELTEGRGVDIVYDGTGAETYRDSLACLSAHGTYAYYGGADAQPDPIRLAELPGSVLLTHPIVMDHVPTRRTLLDNAARLFTAVSDGRLRLTLGGVHPLDRADQAHRALESRGTIGKLLLRP